jgi:type IV pilus assembly protein PilC
MTRSPYISNVPVAKDSKEPASQVGPASTDGFAWVRSLGRKLSGRHVTPKQLLVVTNQLAVMLQSGCDLCAGLEAMAKQQQHPYLKEVLEDLHNSVKQGKSFSQSLARHPNVFNNLYVTMIRAGEQAGLLKQMLYGLQTLIRNQIRIAGQIKSALMYPAILMLVAISAIVVMTTFVLPRFAAVFKASNTPLPGSTQFVLAMTEKMAANWMFIIPGIIAFVIALIWVAKHPAIRPTVHAWALKAPLIGPTLKLSACCRSIQTLGLLSKSGLPLADSIILTRDMMGNVHYWQFFNELHDQITEGKGFSQHFDTTSLFPPMVSQMISVGEQTGTLANVCVEVANYHDEELQARIKVVTTALEPIIICMMGGFVGFIAVSVILPLFKLSSTVTK